MAEIQLPQLDNKTESERLEEMKALIPVYAPEWTDHSQSEPGMGFLQLMAWLAAQIQYRLNQVPEKSYLSFLKMIGVTLADGVPAEVDLEFALSAAQAVDVVIPAGTEVSTRRTETEDAVTFTTDEPLTIPAGNVTGTVSATCTQVGSSGNVGANTLVILGASIPYVRSVTNPEASSGWAEPESVEAAKSEAPQSIKNQDRAIADDDHSNLAKQSDQGVSRAWTLPLYDPVLPDQETEGHTTVVIVPVGGGDPSSSLLDAVKTYLNKRRMTSSRLHVMGANRVPVSVTTTVTRVTGKTDQEVIASVVAALDAFLDEEAWPAGRSVYTSEIISTIENAEGVDHLDTLESPSSVITLSKNEVTTPGTHTITVLEP